mmetsp:Transcript_42175/g.97654  ORF Transcript_42175/g.97654 Transcript_42175/m.97654 type:complete len:377 (-) Transcript_42175:110-1240(-)|eukprot:CAMPEP_0171097536 /NCGR_PEP_ID=MMETSP0766_2-20121228/47601_1 /TAXON_ID=439317 /ORGANISM="Gambierdiscus australes, Strain CAWD 149" /LENGTH=376 /DNA_ID=CAMNT_0011556747 /DNA_START=56 /DNA_END=1186 /DNA_ORIENTATION=+
MGYGVPDSGVDFVYVTVHEAYALMKNDKAVFVDSRDLDNYEMTRLQTSFHLSANDLIFAKQKIDMNMVQHLLELVANGKTVIAVSDACITGAKNRGHVSRCRHVAQYLVELGADRTRVVRMTGGINAWKSARLDGVLGGLRPMFAGAWVEEGFKPPEPPGEEEELPTHEEEEEAVPPPAAAVANDAPVELGPGCSVEIGGLKSRADLNGQRSKVLTKIEETGRWEVEVLEGGEKVRVKAENLTILEGPKRPESAAIDLPKIRVCCGGDVQADGQVKTMCEVIAVPPRPFVENTPTAYRVIKGEVFRKPSKDSDKIIKLDRPISSIVRTTGQLHDGANGGHWAELDVTAGEKKGWVYIEGPGFGPSSRKIRSEYLKT